MSTTKRHEIPHPNFGRPHVVILGAGASLAAFPNGDKHGRKLPLMRNIVEVLGLSRLLDRAGILEARDDFEKLYSELVSTGQHKDLLRAIDEALFAYFAEMELPDEPTLYDHLVLSLRKKDVIATFNWDPFLWQALARTGSRETQPIPMFLHGNTAIGYCAAHKPIPIRSRGGVCPRCGNQLQDSKLLYPVNKKNYTDDAIIALSWKHLQHALERAYLVTVFGYSAPVTDVEAINLLRTAWGNPYQREQEQIEIIDIRSENELRAAWDPFIHSHHYEITTDFNDSILGRYPRRSCESVFSAFVDINPLDRNRVPVGKDWAETLGFYEGLIKDEESNEMPT